MDIKKWQGCILLLLAQLMVASCIVGGKHLLTFMPPAIILLIRFSVASIILFPVFLATEKGALAQLWKVSRTDWLYIATQAILAGFLVNILLLFGLHHTTASVAGIIWSALPAVVVVVSVFFLKEKIDLYTSLCVVFAIAGLLVVKMHSFHLGGTSHFYGDLLVFLSLFSEAAYYVMSKYRENKLPVFLVSCLMNVINVPLLLVYVFLFHQDFSLHSIVAHAETLMVVSLGSALFYVFWFLGCDAVSASLSGLIAAFMPVAVVVLACIFLGETISVFQLAGMLLVMGSIGVSALKHVGRKLG